MGGLRCRGVLEFARSAARTLRPGRSDILDARTKSRRPIARTTRPPIRPLCPALVALAAIVACTASCHQGGSPAGDEPTSASGGAATGGLARQKLSLDSVAVDREALREAALAGRMAQRALVRANRFVQGWQNLRDDESALFPESERIPRWSPHNSAADLWPFMVMVSHYTDPKLYKTTMLQTLRDEIRLTSRVGVLPDVYSLTKHRFHFPKIKMKRIIFGASEYAKDGLLPLFELLGRHTPYFDRLRQLIDAILANAKVETARGPLPADSYEVNGELMIVLARLAAATGARRYVEMGKRIAEYYLFDKPVTEGKLWLRDHGGEVVGGMVETYALLKRLGEATDLHKHALKKVLDRILAVGRNKDGLFYNGVNLKTGKIYHRAIADTWGYVYDYYYTFYLLEGVERYRTEVRRVLKNIERYKRYPWEGLSADGYADSIESALVLLNREPVKAAQRWVDSEVHHLYVRQRPTGVVEGWHADGNFGRTLLMYALYHSKGLWLSPWRPDLRLGAVIVGDRLHVHISSAAPWRGKLMFDPPRHQRNVSLPINYPRINEFPEWYPVRSSEYYLLRRDDSVERVRGANMISGIELRLQGALDRSLVVQLDAPTHPSAKTDAAAGRAATPDAGAAARGR